MGSQLGKMKTMHFQEHELSEASPINTYETEFFFCNFQRIWPKAKFTEIRKNAKNFGKFEYFYLYLMKVFSRRL